MFDKILIANRGEIACRIIRTARLMGIKTVSVYSDADKNALHVTMADQAVHIGPSPSAESYLNQEKLIQAAIKCGAKAIHPGYGFLSENPDFVDAVQKAGLVFIGPSSKSIRAMGLKDAAKQLMQAAGVPVVPGYHGQNQDAEFLAAQAEKIGYPVLIKARAGGGGKGMRKVDHAKDFSQALEGAKREGKASFDDDRVLIEKYITAPRHIEVQIFGDRHGNVVHLFERDCSLQRRHQKVIEEAPAPDMSDEMRQAMTSAALKAAKAIDYHGAGTIEFIVDGSKGLKPDGFWFMEMNTRLQVEHPVTEEVTNTDLVEWQLKVAAGEKLPLTQEEISLNGHAFEARIYAEDVSKGFLPAIGKLEHLKFSSQARIESGVAQGDEISPFYDPMIAKVISKGQNRNEALCNLHTALKKTRIAGTLTNKSFLSALSQHDGFANGNVDTGLIERDLKKLTAPADNKDQAFKLAIAFLIASTNNLDTQTNEQGTFNGFRLWGLTTQIIHLQDNKMQHDLAISISDDNTFSARNLSAHKDIIWQCQLVEFDRKNNRIIISCDENDILAHIAQWPHHLAVFLCDETFEFKIPDMLESQAEDEANQNVVMAPMPGLVKLLSAKPGQKVMKDDALVILEAMKMEYTLTAPRDGEIAEVNVKQGHQVLDGAMLVTLKEEQ